jgi:hypothetical protein
MEMLVVKMGVFIANKELSKGNVGKEDAINLWQW